MRPIQALPEGYRERCTLDLTRNLRAALWLQVTGGALFFLFGWLFLGMAARLRPDFVMDGSVWRPARLGGTWASVTVIILTAAAAILLHELVHGGFFWLYTRQRPRFGLGLGYAYAAAPGWYLPRSHYLVIGLSPLIALTLAGAAALLLVPSSIILPLLFGMTVNAAGSVGDLWIIWQVLRQPGPILVNDRGAGLTVYGPRLPA